MKAITPAEAIKQAKLIIPDQVFEAFNELIIQNLETSLGITYVLRIKR